MFSFWRFLRTFDAFGHKQQLTYRGQESYQTHFGAACSIFVLTVTFGQLILYIQGMLEMTDPVITVYEQPITSDEVEEHGQVNFAEHDFYFGAYLTVEGVTTYVPRDIG